MTDSRPAMLATKLWPKPSVCPTSCADNCLTRARTISSTSAVSPSPFSYSAFRPDPIRKSWRIGTSTANIATSRDSLSQLRIVQVDTGQVTALTEEDAVNPAWPPNGHFIAYWGMGRLPDIKGTEIVRRLRSSGDETPVLMLTGWPTIRTAFEVGGCAATAYEAKPIGGAALVSVVHGLARSAADEHIAEPRGIRQGSQGPDSDTFVRCLTEITECLARPRGPSGVQTRRAARRSMMT